MQDNVVEAWMKAVDVIGDSITESHLIELMDHDLVSDEDQQAVIKALRSRVESSRQP